MNRPNNKCKSTNCHFIEIFPQNTVFANPKNALQAYLY